MRTEPLAYGIMCFALEPRRAGLGCLTAREAIDGKNGLGQTKGGIHEVEKNVFGRTVAGFVDGHIESGVVVQQPVHGPTAR